jgi:hypothetical protein
MTNDNEQAGSRIENKLRELVQAQAAAEAWARDNDLVLQQAAQIEQLKAERALLVEVLQECERLLWHDSKGNCPRGLAAARARAALAKAGGAQ